MNKAMARVALLTILLGGLAPLTATPAAAGPAPHVLVMAQKHLPGTLSFFFNRKVQREIDRVSKKVEREIKRVGKQAEKEADRFLKRADREIDRTVNKVEKELRRFGRKLRRLF